MTKKQWRALVVRAIEDGTVLFLMGACCWSICYLASEIFEKLGVGG